MARPKKTDAIVTPRKVNRGNMRRMDRAAEKLGAALAAFCVDMKLAVEATDATGNPIEWPAITAFRNAYQDLVGEMRALKHGAPKPIEPEPEPEEPAAKPAE